MFTVYGFISIVKNTERAQTLLVRTRDRETLDRLLDAYPAELKGCAVIETPANDYPYRLIVNRAAWCTVAFRLAESISYENFKNEAEAQAVPGDDGDRYLMVLHDLWGMLFTRYAPLRPREARDAR